MTGSTIYDQHLDRTPANFTPLSPLSYIERTAAVYPDYPSVVYGDRRYTWAETYTRCRRLASALAGRGLGKGDTVSIIAANIPEMYEAHFGVPMAGAVLNAINTRLDAPIIAFILSHAEARVLIVDPEFSEVVRDALAQIDRPDLLVVDIEDPSFAGGAPVGTLSYDALLAEGDPDFDWSLPGDEWDAIALNYTSGTTGNPKGVVYHHRGAALNATSNILTWGMPQHAVYLWTLPMFHCNGWCFPWTMAANAGVSVCLRAVRDEPIYRAFREEKVTHFCGAPIVLNMLANAPDHMKDFDHQIKVMTAGAPPPAAVIEKMEAMGVDVTHVYGLTETYGPSVVCAWKEEWDGRPGAERAALKVRQGVRYVALSGLMVADPETLEPVPADGETMGEIFMQGNIVMKGYLKNPDATDRAFRGGWFASGDLGVMHPDGYIALKDRSKDIIISGGENISSVEVEDVLYKHPAVMEAAVVARPDEKWGETPCAFVELKPGQSVEAADLIAHCRANMAHFKAPKTVVFGELPKTSTGKIQKFLLRERARAL
ncbi:acyl-CoA synthetase [Ruegeria pomeroyi]|jgi:fatty-acyl-CoA synthase|uniref:3-methylmercaptopropionyl-CoA ligase n=2 Tax=Ruegeria pomeroyi TaxID=89184 RepID=Q5LVM3_RUEPO|nr:acyl-CoA synthetase [Ruegeria pomeroyi]AAV93985.1 3-methylmercaptopropionyl-CoA ligase [Ruegeria pomeroyi DSS-3]NVK95298.1 acyl-CoA synthetase [Ruegeria pomeroyi]NVL01074.1 acyl-CoA synthetase [Ruegeria pomeroyi]QWV07570.1 acyl-CoA synthetase [Ruegeria pomeroyi]